MEENILFHGKDLSIETIFELSILLNSKAYSYPFHGIDISKLYSFKFDSLDPIFDFIKKHKSESKKDGNNANNIGSYIDLIYCFYIF